MNNYDKIIMKIKKGSFQAKKSYEKNINDRRIIKIPKAYTKR